jgi:polygalacturonase
MVNAVFNFFLTIIEVATSLTVVASNSVMKGQIKCLGVNDQIQIQAAINLLPITGGTVILSDGTFMMSNQISLVSNIILRGQGMKKTLLKTVDNCPQFRKAGLVRGI